MTSTMSWFVLAPIHKPMGYSLDKMTGEEKVPIRVKVLTLLTLLVINDLSPYTTPYKFPKVLTSFVVKDLSAYIWFLAILAE